MKKLLITALVLVPGLTACSGEKTDGEGGDASKSSQNDPQNDEAPKAELASFEIEGMT